MKHDAPVNHPELQCSVYDVTYNFPRRVGVLVMGEGDACDMGGCIAFFQRIDPKVESISTRSGNEPDTSYYKQGDKWIAKP